ncbi:MAG: iron-containing alcohol dehydrogenase, partial [Candidatus Ornithospirochaeta sp.]
VYSDVVANPTSDNVNEASRLYRETLSDCLIGVGGGSSIDTAKAVGAVLVNPKKPLSKMGGILKVRKKIPLLIAVPTTAGTGSEATLASVVVDSRTRHKYAINDFPLIPRYALLDPNMTKTLPKGLTATTGMDALTHAVEAYIGKSNHRMTKIEAKIAVRLIINNIEKAWENGDDEDARAAMLRASYLAGCSFTRSYVGYVHAVAHSLGGKYNIPHGYANAVILPIVLRNYGKKIEKKLWKLAVASGLADELTPPSVGAKAFLDKIDELNNKFGIPSVIPEIKDEDIEELAHYADKEANPLYPVPVLMDKEELKKFYYILKG